jgi:hypothetical protein
MLMDYIFYIFKFCLTRIMPLYLIILSIKNRNPDEYNRFIVNISYNAIYLYSKGQILFKKLFKYLNTVVEKYPQLKLMLDGVNEFCNKETPSLDLIEYVKNGEVIGNYSFNSNDTHPDNFDFIVISYHTKDREKEKDIYKKILYSNSLIQKPDEIIYEVSDIQFILVEFNINDETFVINMKDNKRNYYLVDNKIDLKFMLYYVNKYYSEKIDIKNLNMNKVINNFYIKIIDNNVNIVKITKPDDFIILKKDGYNTLIEDN